MQSFNVLNKSVSFSEEEIEIFNSAGLNVDSEFGDFIEMLFVWDNITEFSESITEEEVHDMCIKAIAEYDSIVEKTMYGLGLDPDHVSQALDAEDERLQNENR